MDRQSFYHQLLNEAVDKVNPIHWVVRFDSGNNSLPAHSFSVMEDNTSWIQHKLVSIVFVGTLVRLVHQIGPVERAEHVWLHDPDSLDKIVKFLEKVKELELEYVRY